MYRPLVVAIYHRRSSPTHLRGVSSEQGREARYLIHTHTHKTYHVGGRHAIDDAVEAQPLSHLLGPVHTHGLARLGSGLWWWWSGWGVGRFWIDGCG